MSGEWHKLLIINGRKALGLKYFQECIYSRLVDLKNFRLDFKTEWNVWYDKKASSISSRLK